jgi:hypothetical protein
MTGNERSMPCSGCGSTLGCAVDCPWAPWNDDLRSASPFVHLVRLVRWCRKVGHSNGPMGFTLSELRWLKPARRAWP